MYQEESTHSGAEIWKHTHLFIGLIMSPVKIQQLSYYIQKPLVLVLVRNKHQILRRQGLAVIKICIYSNNTPPIQQREA